MHTLNIINALKAIGLTTQQAVDDINAFSRALLVNRTNELQVMRELLEVSPKQSEPCTLAEYRRLHKQSQAHCHERRNKSDRKRNRAGRWG